MAKAMVLSLGTGPSVESDLKQSIKQNNPEYIIASGEGRAIKARI